MSEPEPLTIVIIGNHIFDLLNFKKLFEVYIPNSQIHISPKDYPLNDNALGKWDLIIYLILESIDSTTFEQVKRISDKDVPIMCIVNKDYIKDYQLLIDLGVRAIIGYDSMLENIRTGISSVLKGGLYIDSLPPQKAVDQVPLWVPKLSEQEWKIYKYIAQGLTPNDLIQKFSLSSDLLQKHIEEILRKTDSKTLPQAIAKGVYLGWINMKKNNLL